MEREYPMHFNDQHQHSSDAERSCDGRLPLRQGVRRAGLLSLGRHSLRCCFLRSNSHESTFLRSLRSIPITRLHRYYGRSDSCSPRLFGTWSMNSASFSEQVSLIYASDLSNHSVSNHLMDRCHRFHTLPFSSTAFRSRSRLRLRMAGSPIAPGRIEFVILRTGRSPPAALHHTSLCRSCIRLQAGERLPREDFHLSDHLRFQAHHPVATTTPRGLPARGPRSAPGTDLVPCYSAP
jgi:hypothetical protein